jgi:hypothetical protein
MKKALVIVLGLVFSAGLYAAKTDGNCKFFTNFLTTLSGKKYVLNGNVCVKLGTSTETMEDYVANNADGKYKTVTNRAMTLSGKAYILNGWMKVEKAEDVAPEGQTLSEFLKDIFSQLWNNKGHESEIKPIDSK